MKTTLIIGASNNPDRYSYKAANMLHHYGRDFIPFGVKRGVVANKTILNDWNTDWKVDTVTLYVNPKIQKDFYEKIIALSPQRVIFNPGTENYEFEILLQKHGIATDRACTLVLLSTGMY